MRCRGHTGGRGGRLWPRHILLPRPRRGHGLPPPQACPVTRLRWLVHTTEAMADGWSHTTYSQGRVEAEPELRPN